MINIKMTVYDKQRTGNQYVFHHVYRMLASLTVNSKCLNNVAILTQLSDRR